MRPHPCPVNRGGGLTSDRQRASVAPMQFASDNTSGIPAPVLSAITDAAQGYAMGYGADATSDALRQRLRNVFEAPQAEIALVPTGTAANSLALSCICPPWGAILCHAQAHINVDEAGAPEFYTSGAKLVAVDGKDATPDLGALRDALRKLSGGGVHQVRPSALSLSNLTECGTVMTPDQIAVRAELVRAAGLAVHLDGARLANALASTGASPAQMTWRAGVDALSLGGTKNGLAGVEAVMIFDPARATDLATRRKRAGQLVSKYRFLSAQMLVWLQDDLWLDLARMANGVAGRLEQGLRARGVSLRHVRGGNMIFADLCPARHAALQAAGARYYTWANTDDPHTSAGHVTARLVTSWSSTNAEVDAFLQVLDTVKP